MTTHAVSSRTYFLVFGALVVLLVISVLAARTEHHLLNNVIAMTIAVSKMLLIMLYFMHLKDSSRLTQVFAFAAFLWLAILMALTLSDFHTRSWLVSAAAEMPRVPAKAAQQ